LKNCNTKTQQQGLTLIELMIAIVLGLLITAAVIQLFVNNKQTYRITESQMQLQNNARFALNALSKDIRLAGFSGCRTVENMNVYVIASGAVASVTENTVITGTENWGLGTSATLGEVKASSDVFTLQRAQGCGATLTGNLSTAHASVQVYSPNRCNLQANDVLMIADCEDAHIFRATTVSDPAGETKQTIAHASNVNQANRFCKGYETLPQAGNCDAGTNKLYSYDAELYKFVSTSYFIRDDQSGHPALWAFDHNSATNTVDPDNLNPQVMVEGISDMQINYGIDDNDDDVIDDYKTAQAITNASEWHKVISAELSLLVETQETNLRLNDQQLSYNGVTTSETDGRIRRVFSTTVGIRNRVQ